MTSRDPSQTLSGLIGALAFAGDLSMGQPPDHSPRTAVLAALILDHVGLPDYVSTAVRLGLLRWSGCTANAAEFDELFGDDVAGRAALISGQNPFINDRRPGPDAGPVIHGLSRMHCDTGVMLIGRIALDDRHLVAAFAQVFEAWDGSGLPAGLAGEDIRPEVQAVSLASDLEIWSRVHGLSRALSMLEAAAGSRHDPALVAGTLRMASDWLRDISHGSAWDRACTLSDLTTSDEHSLDEVASILGDFADLKVPELQRPGRRVADLLAKAGAEPVTIRAGRLHRLGWVSVANRIARTFDPREINAPEACRLVPHWSARCLSRLAAMGAERHRIVRAYERADGHGFPAGLSRAEMSVEDTLLQAAVLIGSSNMLDIERAVEDGAICRDAAARIAEAMEGAVPLPTHSALISEREREVLHHLASGLSNKEIARSLGISPSTVGTHVENIYRKLGVGNRATATLKGLEHGLLS